MQKNRWFNNIGGHETRRIGCRLVARKNKLLPPNSNAVDTPICIATGVMTDRSTRYRSRREHDAGSCHATDGIADVLAVHDRVGWHWVESETCKPQQDASGYPGNCR